MAVEGTKRRQIARVASYTVESSQILGLFLDIHHHLDRLLQPAGVLLCLGRVAQQVLQYRNVVVNSTPRPPQVLSQSQLLLADLSNSFCIVLLTLRVSVKSQLCHAWQTWHIRRRCNLIGSTTRPIYLNEHDFSYRFIQKLLLIDCLMCVAVVALSLAILLLCFITFIAFYCPVVFVNS